VQNDFRRSVPVFGSGAAGLTAVSALSGRVRVTCSMTGYHGGGTAIGIHPAPTPRSDLSGLLGLLSFLRTFPATCLLGGPPRDRRGAQP